MGDGTPNSDFFRKKHKGFDIKFNNAGLLNKLEKDFILKKTYKAFAQKKVNSNERDFYIDYEYDGEQLKQ